MKKVVVILAGLIASLAILLAVETMCLMDVVNDIEEHKITAVYIPVDVECLPRANDCVKMEPMEPIEPAVITYDVPLGTELQQHIIEVSKENGIEPEIIFAMAYRESRFKVDAVGDSGASVGLLQIQKRWHSGRMKKLGCTDLSDPYQNVIVGVDFLAELLNKYGDIGKALTAYNRGSYKGAVTEYATSIITMAEELGATKHVQN